MVVTFFFMPAYDKRGPYVFYYVSIGSGFELPPPFTRGHFLFRKLLLIYNIHILFRQYLEVHKTITIVNGKGKQGKRNEKKERLCLIYFKKINVFSSYKINKH